MGHLRHLERQARRLNGESHPKTLEVFNDSQPTNMPYLHPTKGWRRMSERRSQITLLTAEIKHGKLPFSMTIMQAITRNKSLAR